MSVRLYFYRHVAICLASEHVSNLHKHRALQCAVGLNGPFRLDIETERGYEQLHTDFAFIAPDQKHQLDATGVDLALLFMDCGIYAYLRWLENGGRACAPNKDVLDTLRTLYYLDTKAKADTWMLVQRWCDQTLNGLSCTTPANPRIAKALELIDQNPVDAGNYVWLADKVHLSASRFANVFRQNVGIPVRNYILWQRLVLALDRLKQGDSITAAAYNAGFSDCAHLSRSFHQIFGVVLSDIMMTKTIAQPTIDTGEFFNAHPIAS